MTDIKKPSVLIYDIETSPLWYRGWRLGENVIRHAQLLPCGGNYSIICIAYTFNNEPVQVLTWDMSTGSSETMIMEFDKIIQKADVVIGKNNNRFDDKHINTQRLIHGLEPIEWLSKTDDLETQLRRHFSFPSYSLDYVSTLLNKSGKVHMEWSDWEHIDNYRVINQIKNNGVYYERQELSNISEVLFNKKYSEIVALGEKAFAKMIKYNKVDVEQTRKLWNKVKAYIKPKFSNSMFNFFKNNIQLSCVICGSTNIVKNGTQIRGSTEQQKFYCNSHHGHAGYAIITKDKKGGIKYGKLK